MAPHADIHQAEQLKFQLPANVSAENGQFNFNF
jgi:hypothetical protein